MSRSLSTLPSHPSLARRFVRNRLSVFGLVLFGLILLLLIGGQHLIRYDPFTQNLRGSLAPPSWEHPFGTDFHGRDLLSRVIYGGRISILVGVTGVFLAVILGSVLGMTAGYYGGIVDALIMRLIDIMLAFPSMLLAVLVAAILGIGLKVVVIAICVFQIPSFARLTRGMVLSIKERDFVIAAKGLGFSHLRIQARHILPNCIGLILVQTSLNCAWGILTVAWMSFLGFGAQPPIPELGAMVNEGRGFLRQAAHYAFFPGLAITLIVLSLNFIGDGLRDAFDVKKY